MAQITLNSTGVASNGSLVLQSNGTTTAVTIDTSQRAAFVAGTAALPAITTTGDTNTGIFFPAADTIAFSEGGAESMRIDSSGNVGIGTTSPAYRIDVNKGSAGVLANFTDGVNANFQISTAPYVTTIGPSAVTTSLVLQTSGTEAARIDSSGNLLVGTTSSSGTVVGSRFINGAETINCAVSASTNGGRTSYELYSTGAGAYRFYVGAGGTIFATSTVITAISDQRLKENVRDIDTGLSSIMALKPRRFDWKESKGQDKKNVAGFIAQEFEDVFPECVSTSKAGADGIEYKNINHETLIPTLVKAIQEQQALITQLTARITALEGA